MERSDSLPGEPGTAPDSGPAAQTAAHTREQQRPPLPLARPLELFEPACTVAGTAALCLPDPDMLARIVWGHSLEGVARRHPSKSLRDLHQAMRKAEYILEGKHQPTDTTVKVIAQTFAPFQPQETTAQLLRGEFAQTDLPPFLPWREFQRLAGPIPAEAVDTSMDEMVAYLVGREAFYARMFHHERAGRASPERESFETRVQPGLDAWRVLNPGLMQTAFLLVEELLHGIARFDSLWSRDESGDRQAQGSPVTTLLATGRRPMGHWLRNVALANGTRSLSGLQQVLFTRDVRYKGDHKEDPFIKTDLLKKWSASRQMLMPLDALAPVLTGVPEALLRPLEGRYFVARLLSFLIDLVRAGTQGKPPTWDEAQKQVGSRYTEVHRLELAALAA